MPPLPPRLLRHCAGRVTLKPRKALQGASDLDAEVSGMEEGATEV